MMVIPKKPKFDFNLNVVLDLKVMEKICRKLLNQNKLYDAIKTNYLSEEFALVISQLIWERHVLRTDLQQLYDNLRQKKFGWNWYPANKEIEDTTSVVPGALQCHKCGNNRIWTRTRQTRSGDEGQTVFAICVECKHRWICNN